MPQLPVSVVMGDAVLSLIASGLLLGRVLQHTVLRGDELRRI
jgi:hypothetical protein